VPQYANLSGTSNVVSYQLTRERTAARPSNFGGFASLDADAQDAIEVTFGDGSVYTYTVESVGRDDLAGMILLAKAGAGLNSFINKYVRFKYASKRRG
jgi:hypothetical protein